MADDKQPSGTPEPQTSVGAFVRVFELIFARMPWLVIIAVLYVGFYKYQELMNQTKKDATDYTERMNKLQADSINQINEQMRTANTEVRSTYDQLGNMSKQMIHNLNELLVLQEKVRKELSQQQDAASGAKAEAALAKEESARAEKEVAQAKSKAVLAQEELALARKAAEEARLAADTARKQAEEANNAIASANRDLEQAKLTKEKIEAETRGKIVAGASEISHLKSNVQEFAKYVTANEQDEDAAVFIQAREILAQYTENPLQWLTAFNESPSKGSKAQLRNLIGLNEQTLRANVSLLTGTAGWCTNEDSVFIVGRQTDWSYENMVALWMDKGRIYDVEVKKWVALVNASKSDNWFVPSTYSLDEPFDDGEIGFDLMDEDDLAEAKDIPSSGVGLKPLQPLQVEEFQQRFPAVYARVLTNASRHVSALAMVEQAKSFSTAQINLNPIASAPTELRDQFADLLQAAVRRDFPRVKIISASGTDTNLVGQLAAFVLRPGFALLDARPLYSVNLTSQTALAEASEKYSITASVPFPEGRQLARAEFTKEPKGVWLFSGFSYDFSESRGISKR